MKYFWLFSITTQINLITGNLSISYHTKAIERSNYLVEEKKRIPFLCQEFCSLLHVRIVYTMQYICILYKYVIWYKYGLDKIFQANWSTDIVIIRIMKKNNIFSFKMYLRHKCTSSQFIYVYKYIFI